MPYVACGDRIALNEPILQQTTYPNKIGHFFVCDIMLLTSYMMPLCAINVHIILLQNNVVQLIPEVLSLLFRRLLRNISKYFMYQPAPNLSILIPCFHVKLQNGVCLFDQTPFVIFVQIPNET